MFAIFLSSLLSSGTPRAHSKRPCVFGGGVLASPSFSVENVSLSHCLRVKSCSYGCFAGVRHTRPLKFRILCFFTAGLIWDCDQLDCFRNKVVSSKCLMDCDGVGV